MADQSSEKRDESIVKATSRKEMRAVTYESNPREVVVASVPKPTLQDPEDAIVRITSTTICGSDLHIYHGLHGTFDQPFGIGHEAVGIVEQVGEAVDYLKPGDRVVTAWISEDGRLNPKPVLSTFEDEGLEAVGATPALGQPYGLQAQYIRIPWADSSLVKIPHTLDDKEWLPLADAWPCAWTALDRSGFESGDTVAVFGAGPVGLMAAYSAILRGASTVYVVDHLHTRLSKAASIGAIPINFTRGGSASQQILRLRPNGVKRTIDAVGATGVNADLIPQQDYVIQEAVAVTRTEGGLGIAGLYFPQVPPDPAPGYEHIGPTIQFPIAALFFKQARMVGGPHTDFQQVLPKLVELVRSGRGRPGFIFTTKMSLEDAPKAYRRFEAREEVKILLEPEG